MKERAKVFVAVVLLSLLSSLLRAQPAPLTEDATTSRLTGTSFGATPERDLRPASISAANDYLAGIVKQNEPNRTLSDMEVIFWRSAVTAAGVEAYQKLVNDNLTKGGYVITQHGSQTAGGVTTSVFVADSDQLGSIIGYWQASPQGLYLNWGRTAAPAAPAVPLPPAAPPAPAISVAPAVATPAADPAPVPAGVAGAPVAQAPDKTPLVALDSSALVTKDAKGTPIVADKAGKGIDGIKLSQHDRGINSPSITVGSDGTIHVAFIESHRTTYAYAVYYRGSSDGGKTWTDVKNLSEDMVAVDVGHTQVLVDSHNRVYVIWRAALAENWMIGKDWQGERTNLWYRVLDGGKWSKITPIGDTAAQATILHAAISSYEGVDAAGNVQVIWSVCPDPWHPEYMANGQHANGVGNGLVLQSTLDGVVASKPRELFVSGLAAPDTRPWPNGHGASCDDLDTLNGYFDSNGSAHLVAEVTGTMYGANPHKPWYQVIEDGKGGQIIKLPELSFHAWKDIPTLLVDAKGKRHVIAMFLGGEHPNVRDYLIGSDDEPTVIRAAVGLNGTIDGFQAYQGPGGRMAVIMQMYDNGDKYGGENYVSLSTGDGKWSEPVNVTNNAGRKAFTNAQTSPQSNVGQITACMPGQCAAAFDKDGHLNLLLIKGEYSITIATAFGVNTAGGDATIPTLRFLRF